MSGSSAQGVWQKPHHLLLGAGSEFAQDPVIMDPLQFCFRLWEHTTLTPQKAVKGWLGFQDRCVRRADLALLVRQGGVFTLISPIAGPLAFAISTFPFPGLPRDNAGFLLLQEDGT